MQRQDGPDWVAIYLIGLLLVAFLVLIAAAGHDDRGSGDDRDGFGYNPAPSRAPRPGGPEVVPGVAPGPREDAPPVKPSALPWGRARAFDGNRMLVAYYGTPDMIRRIDRVARWPHLALVQHADGFGTPRQKLATFRRVVRPARFTLGFELFYDEDVRRLRPAQVLRIRPQVRFVSFQ